MIQFRVFPDCGDPNDYDPVESETAEQAASALFCDLVMKGDARAGETMVLCVEHDRGPDVDPSATWYTDEDGTFALFRAEVERIEVAVKEEKR